eukprot:CAMPEP_0173430668 /NCGR_PEP_ID=MMETSP1357-20121228/9027_1 /TAXON_ID=77926 /ORGANISM="Hemiselmis rufescens, Strain PCC563" /LENGTH=390 /DNA_ID=CAMNT_0014395045 /DNA_START=158 /DNA_END=1327 /DNA_ORIENTATION=-
MSFSGRVPEFDPKYVCNAFVKIAQVVGEARLLGPGVRERPKKRDFLLETKSPEEMEEELQGWVQDFLSGSRSPLVMTIAADAEGVPASPRASPRGSSCRMITGGLAQRYRVLERWSFSYQQGAPGEDIPAYSVAKQLFLLVRSVHSCLRMLPCHKMVAKMRGGGGVSARGLRYRLSTTAQPDRSEYPFGGDLTTDYRFGDVETPSGRVVVSVEYLVGSAADLVAPLEDPLMPRERSISLPADPMGWAGDGSPLPGVAGTPAARGGRAREPMYATPEGHRTKQGTPTSAPHVTSIAERPEGWHTQAPRSPVRRSETEPMLPLLDSHLQTIPGSREGEVLAFSGSPDWDHPPPEWDAAHRRRPDAPNAPAVVERGFHVPPQPQRPSPNRSPD